MYLLSHAIRIISLYNILFTWVGIYMIMQNCWGKKCKIAFFLGGGGERLIINETFQ